MLNKAIPAFATYAGGNPGIRRGVVYCGARLVTVFPLYASWNPLAGVAVSGGMACSTRTGPEMTRTLPGLVVLLLLAGCAHGPSAGLGAPEADPPAVMPLANDDDTEGALMLGVLAGEIAVRAGAYEEAARYYAGAALVSDDPAIAERATRIALFARQHGYALQASARWRELAPESMEALQVSTVLLMEQGQPEAAAQQLGTVIDTMLAEGSDPYPLIGSLLARTEDRDAAMDAVRMLAASRANDVGVHRVYVEVALRFQPAERALEAAREAGDRFPGSVPLQLLHARALSAAGHSDAALQALQALVEAHPDSREARLGYARELAEHEDSEFARREMDRLVERAPDDVQLLTALALLNLEAGHLGSARDYLERLDALGQRRDDVAYYFGRLHELEQAPARAREAYARVGAGEYADDARLRVARLTLELDGHEAARGRFDRMQQDSDSELARQAYLVEANTLREQREYGEARDRLNRGLIQFPGDSRLLYLRGLVHEREDNIAAAEADFRAILAAEPDNVSALNALGYTLADRTDRYAEALELIERAYEQKPDDAAIVDSYGWVLYRLGRLEEAETHLRRAYGMMQDGEIASNLAVVLWERGERKEARAILEAALEREPDHERLRRVHDDLIE